MRALLMAVRNGLRSDCSYSPEECEIGWDGQPPPRAGQVFAAVHPGAVQSDHTLSLRERVALSVTLTMRVAHLPVDKYGEHNLVFADEGLYARAEALRAYLHMNYPVMDAANTIIGSGDNGYVEPLMFQNMTLPQERFADWFWAEHKETTTAPLGLSITLAFGNALRVQVIEEQS